jgi:17beta-estradiol 17-dehydrogenase / very-long-chain 3-oxoacyl-CoA reductase
MTSMAYIALSYVLYKIFRGIYVIVYPYLIATPLDLHKLAGNAKWAAITGSTDGIGKQYALELAERGFNLLLISRTKSKLESVKQEIATKYSKIEIDIVAYDFKNANLDDYKKEVLPALEKREIGILINNVGLAYDYADQLHHIDLQRNADICIVNCVPVSVLTAAIIPQMLKRNAGIIVNISSGAGYGKMSYFSIYSATKAYINHFTNILRAEYANTGLTIQTICPFMVLTNMSASMIDTGIMSQTEIKMMAVPVKDFVKQAIKTIGIMPETTGCLSHQIQASLFGLPEFVVDYMLKFQTQKFSAVALIQREKAAKQQ